MSILPILELMIKNNIITNKDNISIIINILLDWVL